MNGERMLTVREVSDRLRVPEATIRRWLRDGRLRGVRLGGTRLGYRIAESDVEAFVRASYGEQGKAAA